MADRLVDAQAGQDRLAAEAVFARIYSKNEWQGSGPGSLPEATSEYRYFLETFIRANRVRSVVDVGCGDWQFSRYVPWDGVHYLGVDVVQEVVQRNVERFGSDSIRFARCDARVDVLPDAELLLIKDVLQHWPNTQVARFLPTVRRFKYALVTNTTNRVHMNRDCELGGYRYLDLTRPPFNVEATVVLRYVASAPGMPADEKSVLLCRGGGG